jgi:phosphoenolpyruvate synthase/pyruvate phosphate dikinase
MSSDVLGFEEIEGTDVALAGGKGAHLAALSRLSRLDVSQGGIDDLRVPAGFCVTTAAFARVLDAAPALDERLARLARVEADDREAIRTVAAEIRRIIASIVIPADLAAAVTRRVAQLGAHAPCAVRSSATAEDLPAASFAGQHDTYLHIVGAADVLRHISHCWASLFTERAISYRARHGGDHRAVRMAVVIQRMVAPQAAGVVFTADPVTGNRKVTLVEATAGLADALVAGVVKGDIYKVRDAEVIAATRHERRTLTDAQVLRLARLGRRIESHFGCPQDIEWCLADGDLHIVQARPITTLFPVPEGGDGENRAYVSVGHQQMMTDAMKPLGLSFWQLTTPATMVEAGGRLFVDVTRRLASPADRAGLLAVLGRSDPLMADALQVIVDRGDFVQVMPDDTSSVQPPPSVDPPLETEPAIVRELVSATQASIAALKRDIRTKSGPALLDFILEDIQELKRLLFDPRSHQVVMAGIEATWWLNEQLPAWLGEQGAADTLVQSAPGNVTSEMGLALLDVADAVRPYPEVVSFLERVGNEGFLDEVTRLAGGRDAHDAIVAWLEQYGMRGAGEIDITRPRWAERPSLLVPLILANVRNCEAGAGRRRFEAGRRAARDKEEAILDRLRTLPDGERKAADAKRMIDRLRTFIGYREYPKYGMVSRYFIYKQALMAEAARLVQAGVFAEVDEMFFLRFQELRDVVRSGRVDEALLQSRKAAFRSYRSLIPPRVLTSDGEAVGGAGRQGGIRSGALAGLPVSAGRVEGRARVALDMSITDLEAGDILVTTCTDPGWTPLLVSVKGLVTEVGGLMTHGAVIAREYGLPAVVGVDGATRLIRDGQRIRVDGTLGWVEILP